MISPKSGEGHSRPWHGWEGHTKLESEKTLLCTPDTTQHMDTSWNQYHFKVVS